MNIKKKFLNFIRVVMMYGKAEKYVPIITPVDKDELLKGKVALITGGSSGIGKEIAKVFLASGAKVIIAGTNEQKLIQCCSDLKSSENLKYIVINVKCIECIEEKVNEAVELFDERKIDILVNSAGIDAKHNFMEIQEKEYDAIMDTNVKGTYFMCQAVAKTMIDKKIKGHILNISSSSALRPAWTPYQMSKWAIRGFTMGLADTLLPYGIIVNAIGPGQTATPLLGKENTDNIYNGGTVAKRYVMPCEVASLALFMVSDAGNMIVGDTYYITGGSGTITYHK